MKTVIKRFLSLTLAFLMVLSLLPAFEIPAYAATSGTVTGLTDENIGLSFTGDADNAWSANGTSIIGAATSTGGTCSDTSYKSTLTITNKKSTTATLSFVYAIEQNSGTIQVDGTEVSSGASFTKELAANESVKVYIKSGSTVATKITLTNVALVSDVTATVTFLPAENGTYTVDGKLITEEYSNTQSSMTAYQVVATPADGYQFMGWYDVSNEKYISTSAKAALNIENDCTITARFASKTAALFETGGQRFDDLGDAVSYAQANSQSKITLATDGSISGSYTIPAGITLLIPFDEAGTLYTDAPAAIRTTPASKPFRTLRMSAGASITVNGAISLGGRYFAAGGGQQGRPVGDYGYIKMADNSSITVKNGGNLYAWGFISGSGSILAESGATVYEFYQIADFRGGSASSNMGNKVFPFSQYFVQNIEVPLTLNAGANEQVYSGVFAMSTTYTTAINFIGDTGMFKVESGSFTKDYDEKADRLVFTVNGEAALNTLSLKLAGMSVNSASYVLPITNNITINIQSGNVTINQDAALLAGVEVNIAEGAGLTVANGKNIYFYDSDEWNSDTFVWGPCKFKSVAYAPGKAYNRSDKDLVDAKMDVNGSVTAIGAIYTTAGGADICSSNGTGIYNQEGAPGTETETHQYNASSTDIAIPITPAKLHNADGTYTETAAASAGDTINYVNGFWGGEARSVIFHANYEKDGAHVNDVYKQEIADFKGAKLDTIETIQKETTTEGVSPFNRDGEYQLFVGWGKSDTAEKADLADGAEITEDIFKADEGEKYNSSIDLYALWKQAVEVSFDANGGAGAMEPVVYDIVNGKVPAADNSLPACTFTKDGCMFTGWTFSVDSGTDDFLDKDRFTLPDDQLKEKGIHITLYANWAEDVTVTVTYDANDGTGTMDAQTVKKGTEVTLSANTFTREGYTFTGWNTVAAPTTDNPGTAYAAGTKVTLTENITLYAQWKCAHGETEVRNAKAATCTEKGYTGDTYCKTCGEKIADGKEIPAKGHTEVIDAAVEATCTTPGKTEGKHCSVCNEVLVAQKEIPAKGHSWDEGKVTTAATCTVDGVKTYTCTVCNETKTEAISKTGHTSVDVPEKPATCTEAGYEAGTKCSVCGATLSGLTEIPAKGHTEVIDPAVEATCTTPGKTEGKHCSVCNEVIVAQTEIPATGHSWDEGKVTTAATCTVDGVKTYTCTVCNETKTEAISATGHTSVDVPEKPATCTEAGYEAGTKCSVCGATLSGLTEIPAKGHVTVTDPAVEATCTKTGKTEGKHCSVCNEVLVAQTVIPAKGHSWNEGTVTTAATCTEDGVKTYTCTVCNETKTEAISATGHTSVDVPEKPATCTEAGYEAGTKCSVCGATLSGLTEIPAKGHVTVTDPAVEATCTEPGKTEGKHCSVCNEVLVAQKEIPAKGHTEVIDKAVEATCTTPGKTEGKHCSVCNEVLVAQTVIPAKDHSWDEGKVTTAATCTVDGVKTYTCTVCNETKTEAISKTGHTSVDVPEKPATCTEAGYEAGTKCSVCGATISGLTVIPTKGHVAVTDPAVEATCTKPGKTEGKHCSVCNKVLVAQKEIPAKGHTEVIDPAVEATCTETGKTEGKHCSVCNEVLVAQTVLPKKDHTEEIRNAKEATLSEDGYTGDTYCSVCNTLLHKGEEIPRTGVKITWEITWPSSKETTSEVVYVTKGSIPAYSNTDSLVEVTVERTYTFARWQPEPTAADADTTYTAVFNESTTQHKVTWVIDENDPKKNEVQYFPYGTTPTYTGTPSKAPTETTVYTFTGWNPVPKRIEDASERTYTAQYEETTRFFTITVVRAENDSNVITGFKFGDAIDSSKFDYGKREGYTFDGWTVTGERGTTYAEIPKTMPAENLTLTAKWRSNQYSLKFMNNNAEVEGSGTYSHGDTVTAPTLTNEGWTFNGWVDGDGKLVYGPGVTFSASKDLTLYASWTQNEYRIIYMVNGDKVHESGVKHFGDNISDDDKYTGTPELTGHTFGGWYDNSGFTGDEYTYPDTMPASDIVLYAKMTPNTYKATFYVDGEVYGDAVYVTYGQQIPAPADPSKEGYNFTGWDTDLTHMPAENITIKAQFSAINFAVKLMVNGAYWCTVELPCGAEINSSIKEYTPVLEGYTFTGWDGIPAGGLMPAGNIELNAKFVINTYTITVHGRINDLETYSVTYGANIADVNIRADKTGYTFKGWYSDAEYTTSYTLPDTMPAGNIDLYGLWTVNKYTISFNGNGGPTPDSITADYNSTITLPSPSRTGYTFGGWYIGETRFESNTMPAENLTLTAKWIPDICLITWKNYDGTVIERENAEYGSTLKYTGVTPTRPDGDGYSYTFAGWKDASGNILADGATVSGEAVYTAYYTETPKTFRLVLDYGDGSDSRESNVTFGSVIDVEDPARADYVFDGWVDSSDTKYPTLAASANVTMPAHDLSVVAQWKNAEYKLTLLTDDGSKYISEGINVPWGSLLKSYIPAQESKPGYTLEWRTGALGGGEAIDLDGYVMPKAALTLYAHYSANDITLTFNYKDADYEDASATITSKCDATIDVPVIPTEISISAKQLDGASYTGVFKFTGWSPELPNKTPAQDTEYTAQYVFTGWLDDTNGRTYLADGIKAVPGWKQIDGAWYYFDESSYVVKGLSGEIPAQDGSAATGRYLFDENTGSFKSDHTGPINDGSAIYWVENGKVNVNAGLQLVITDGVKDYYFFDSEDEGKAVVYSENRQILRFTEEYRNGLNLPSNIWYVPGDDGIIVHDKDTDKQGIQQADSADGLYYFVDGVKTGLGLFEYDGSYYYARTLSGKLVCGMSYWITETNGITINGVPIKQGTYQFDNDGKMILRDLVKDGIVEEDGSLYYYKDGSRYYAGLINIDGSYYYVKTSGEVVHGQKYWITKTNGLMKEASYEFGADGKMVVDESVKDGIVKENGSLYYYKDGKLTYAGLINIDGSYYYVKTSGEVVHGQKYWITKTNGMMPERSYTFDAEGKITDPEIISPDPGKNGIVEEDGSLYYYKDGSRYYAGLINIEGSYYYVKTSGEVVHGQKYWITKTNGLMKEASYEFGADGKMVVE